jgi:hypothetical protein
MWTGLASNARDSRFRWAVAKPAWTPQRGNRFEGGHTSRETSADHRFSNMVPVSLTVIYILYKLYDISNTGSAREPGPGKQGARKTG